jgi:hypothetical protein
MRDAAIGCRAHTGWAALVIVAGDPARPDVVARRRIELADPWGTLPRAVYQRSRALESAEAARRVAAAERIAARCAAADFESLLREANDASAIVQSCAVVVGRLSAEMPLESILASHALSHAAEGRLYQQALLEGAEACRLEAVAVARSSIWDEACWAIGASAAELRQRLADIRREIGPPWAEDQKLAALAALVALAKRRHQSPERPGVR